jgi:hypothetical protein
VLGLVGCDQDELGFGDGGVTIDKDPVEDTGQVSPAKVEPAFDVPPLALESDKCRKVLDYDESNPGASDLYAGIAHKEVYQIDIAGVTKNSITSTYVSGLKGQLERLANGSPCPI